MHTPPARSFSRLAFTLLALGILGACGGASNAPQDASVQPDSAADGGSVRDGSVDSGDSGPFDSGTRDSGTRDSATVDAGRGDAGPTCPDGGCPSSPGTCELGVMPIGVPEPTFGITEVAPAPPEPWTAATDGFYYVDATHPDATDTDNPFGTPSLPRASVPRALPAGAVVELHGTYERGHASPNTITASGTATQPVFIRGDAAASPTLTASWQVRGSYFILENLHFAPRDESRTGKLTILGPVDHGVLRHSEVEGNLNAGGVGIASWSDTATLEQVVIYDNRIHDNGNVDADFDQDVHGIAVTARASEIWVLNNEIFRNSGDGIQINAGTANQATTNHIYVGCNVAHNNKQTGFWTKQAVDVIFSQNLSYAHRSSNSSNGAGMGFQYAPERVWFLFNEVRDCEYGISSGSNSGLGFGEDVYLVGNLLHDIHTSTGTFNPDTGWQNGGIMLAGGRNIRIIGNTLYNVDSGIISPSGAAFTIQNNIISNVTQPGGSHIFLESGDRSTWAMSHNLFDDAARIKWGSNTVLDLSAFQTSYPGQCVNCVNADPEFMDPASNDYRLQPSSPAVDRGTGTAVYTTFQSLYGIDISRDFAGATRPQSDGWDMGAYEQ